MTTSQPASEQLDSLSRAITERVLSVDGVAHLAPGWRDLVAQLARGAQRDRRTRTHRADGIAIGIDGTTVWVDISLVIAWPHQARAVCEAVQTAAALAAAQIVDADTRNVHVSVRDVHLDTET